MKATQMNRTVASSITLHPAIKSRSNGRILSQNTAFIVAVWLLLVIPPKSLLGQSYSLQASAVGGGGASQGGGYTVEGLVGQAGIGIMTGGSFTVAGGFWETFQIVKTGLPILTIATGPQQQIIISWSPATPGYVLQESTSLNSAGWSSLGTQPQNPSLIIRAGERAKFYRLIKR
jgi:hypothetical protein